MVVTSESKRIFFMPVSSNPGRRTPDKKASSILDPLVELVPSFDGRNLQDLDEFILLANLVKDCEGSAYVQSIELIIQMKKLLIASLAWVRIVRKGATLIFY